MTAPRISLAQQIEAVRFAQVRQRTLSYGQSVKPMRTKSAEAYDVERLGAAIATLEWLEANRETVLMVQAQIKSAERRAANGGPVR